MAFHIEVDDNRMVCRVSWKSSDDSTEKQTKEDLIDLIKSKDIKGVDPKVIDKAYDTFIEKEKLEDFMLTAGKAPTPPQDGKVKWLIDFKKEEIHSGKVEKDGSIDYRERKRFIGVEKGQLLGTWIPPIPGKSGLDVFGKVIRPLVPQKNKIISGKNIKLSEDGVNCSSTIKGHVLISGLRVSVDRMHKVEGDVDFTTGNIKYPGNIQVCGDIKEKFIVEANGDIVIEGIVDNAEVRATGNILIQKGIIRNSRVIAGGGLETDFIQDSYVECDGKVSVKRSIVKSTVNTNEDIEVISMSGSNGIVGGMVNAGYNVSTYCIGSLLGIKTEVSAGKNSKLFMHYKKLLSNGLKAKENIKRYKYFLDLAKARLGEKISEADNKKLETINKAMVMQRKEFESVLKEIEEIKPEVSRFTSAKVKVYGTAHEGLEISIWNIKMLLKNKEEKTVFYLDQGHNEIICRPINIHDKE